MKTLQAWTCKGPEAILTGAFEPTFPGIEEQKAWSYEEYSEVLTKSFTWYASTRNDTDMRASAFKIMSSFGYKKLLNGIRNSSEPISVTSCKLIRMMGLGFIPHFHEKKFLARDIRKVLNQKKITSHQDSPKKVLSIQDHVEAKLSNVRGNLDILFDEFIGRHYKELSHSEILRMISDSKMPMNRKKDIIEYAKKYIREYTFAHDGVEPQAEGYSNLKKRDIKKCIEWWEDVIEILDTYKNVESTLKSSKKIKNRTTIKEIPYKKDHKLLNLKSINPKSINGSYFLLTFDTSTRKMILYMAQSGKKLAVEDGSLKNFDEKESGRKTIKDPRKMLPKVTRLSSFVSLKKWFDELPTMKLTPSQPNRNTILLKSGEIKK